MRLRFAAAVAFALPLLAACAATHFAPPPLPAPTAPVVVRKAEPSPEPLTGRWYGTLDAPTGRLRLAVTIAQAGDSLTAIVVSVDEGASIRATNATTIGDRLHIELGSVDAVFDGAPRAGAGGPELAGTWTQRGSALPLVLERREKPPPVRRPQRPMKPFLYREEEISYENAAEGVKLAATLTLPEGTGPFPAVLFITGSGPQDRDETIAGHRPFAVIADDLTRRGIATLRADDRGVGGSTGRLDTSTTANLAGDALAGVLWLAMRKEIDPKHIGLIGHSEGGAIASIVATRSKDVAFIVLLAPPGVPGKELLRLQLARELDAVGASKETAARERWLQAKVYDAVEHEADPKDAEVRIRSAWAIAGKEMSDEEETRALAELTSPWFRFFLGYDPRPTLRKVRCPVLAIIGEKDVQVTAKENVPAVRAALDAGGNRDATVRELPGLNHLFQHAKTGSVTEYGQLEETIDPAVLEMIGDFIAHRTVNVSAPVPDRAAPPR
jgi:uncharacterized protein